MNERIKASLVTACMAHPEVKLAYLFGSRARGVSGPTSDYDVAFYIDEKDRAKLSTLHLELIAEVSRSLKTDDVDVVILNTVEQPELAHAIISEGELFYEQEPYRALVEPRILNEYFDFTTILKQHNLTHA